MRTGIKTLWRILREPTFALTCGGWMVEHVRGEMIRTLREMADENGTITLHIDDVNELVKNAR